ncbi:hypothetical protein MesoLj131b_68550 (plasmid) [Mesorhizobium sp. 131-2-5]|nr:hypothetical protein MesoLj131b_68550 [Mesorhizobium sp. 131-2-5]
MRCTRRLAWTITAHSDERRLFRDGRPGQALRFFEQLYRVERQARNEIPADGETRDHSIAASASNMVSPSSMLSMRIPMIPDSDSETKPDTYSDRIPDAIPRRSRTA